MTSSLPESSVSEWPDIPSALLFAPEGTRQIDSTTGRLMAVAALFPDRFTQLEMRGVLGLRAPVIGQAATNLDYKGWLWRPVEHFTDRPGLTYRLSATERFSHDRAVIEAGVSRLPEYVEVKEAFREDYVNPNAGTEHRAVWSNAIAQLAVSYALPEQDYGISNHAVWDVILRTCVAIDE